MAVSVLGLGVHIGVHPEANAGITAYRDPFEGGVYLWGSGSFILPATQNRRRSKL